MGRIYRVPGNITVTNAGGDTDLLSVQPADDKPCRLVGWMIGQISEVQDAAEEGLRLTVRHMTATVTIGSGGSSVTPVPQRPGTDVAAGFTARINDTTVSTTSGTSTVCEEWGWNIRNAPFIHWIPEEQRLRAVQGEVLIVRNETTPADDISAQITFLVEEDG